MLAIPFVRFVLVGVINTLLTYIIYAAGLLFFKYAIAYTISFMIGVVISYYLNTSFAFNSALSVKKAIRFLSAYLLQYLFGLSILYIFVNLLGFSVFIAPVFVLCFSVPVTYLLVKSALGPAVL
jgi:putative flippase GtrA